MALLNDRILKAALVLFSLAFWQAEAATLDVDKGEFGAVQSATEADCEASGAMPDMSGKCPGRDGRSVLDAGQGGNPMDQALQQQWDDGYSGSVPALGSGQSASAVRESAPGQSVRKADLAEAMRAEYLASTEEPKLRTTLKDAYHSLKDLETSTFGTQSSARDPSFALERATVPGGQSPRGVEQPNLIRDLRDKIIDFIDDNPIISVLLAIVGLFGLGFALRT